MKKPYLLIAGWNYYPASGTGDWIGCFETEEDALNYNISEYRDSHNWKKVIDLREWTE
jgi:hypothetical protein